MFRIYKRLVLIQNLQFWPRMPHQLKRFLQQGHGELPREISSIMRIRLFTLVFCVLVYLCSVLVHQRHYTSQICTCVKHSNKHRTKLS